jgi:hypothetical protein
LAGNCCLVTTISAEADKNDGFEQGEKNKIPRTFLTGSSREVRQGQITAGAVNEIVESYASDTGIDIPDAVNLLDARMEWRSEMETVDLYLSSEYEEDRNFAYQLLSRVAPVESTRTENYSDEIALRRMGLEDFAEISDDHGLE